jgi:hypothetical protein
VITAADKLEIQQVMDSELSVAVEAFHAHYDACPACHCEQTALCAEGNRLNEVASNLRNQS